MRATHLHSSPPNARCLVVGPPGAVQPGAIAELVGRLPGAELAGRASAPEVLAGRAPACDVALVCHEHGHDGPAVARDLVAAYPRLAAVVLAHDPGVEVYRDALAAGVRAVVELPASSGALAAAVADASRALHDWAEPGRRGRAVALAGAKGGVGTTTVALGTALAGRGLLVDLADGHDDLAGLLGLEGERSVVDLARLGQSLHGAFAAVPRRHRSGLELVAGARDPDLYGLLPAALGSALVREGRAHAALTVVDAGRGSAPPAREALLAADVAALVVTPDAYAVAAARALAASLTTAGLEAGSLALVVNRFGRSAELSVRAVERAVGVPVAAVVRDDERRLAPLRNGRPELDRLGRTRPLRALRPLAAGAVEGVS